MTLAEAQREAYAAHIAYATYQGNSNAVLKVLRTDYYTANAKYNDMLNCTTDDNAKALEAITVLAVLLAYSDDRADRATAHRAWAAGFADAIRTLHSMLEDK